MKNTIDIEKVYDVHSRRLYNVSLRITGCSADAEEIMQDSLIAYWHFRKKPEIKDLSGWLTSVCIRKSIDRLRERNRRSIFLENYEDPSLEENVEIETSYNIDDILKALQKLPDNYRAIVSLHLFEGYDYQEISQITGAKESTVRTLYMRGRQRLCEMLKNR